MKIISAFHWSKKSNSISYMFIENNKNSYQILVDPIEEVIPLDNFEEKSLGVLNKFFNKFLEYASSGKEVFLEYKTYISQYKKQHKNSEFIEKELSNFINKNQINKKHFRKLKCYPKADIHKKFKTAINDRIYNNRTQHANIIKLWEIALHVTKATAISTIDKLDIVA